MERVKSNTNLSATFCISYTFWGDRNPVSFAQSIFFFSFISAFTAFSRTSFYINHFLRIYIYVCSMIVGVRPQRNTRIKRRKKKTELLSHICRLWDWNGKTIRQELVFGFIISYAMWFHMFTRTHTHHYLC